jgi:hypothetical protein
MTKENAMMHTRGCDGVACRNKKGNRLNFRKYSNAVIYLSLLLLSACTYFNNQHVQFEHWKLCQAHCDQRYQGCAQNCDDNERICKIKNNAITAVHFARYQQQQNVKGQIVAEELSSFRDPLACRKTTCDCDQDKNICKQACRGVIHKRLQYAMQLN